MNPRDKSALQLDAAVKRRMHVIDVEPSVEALGSMLTSIDADDRAKVVDWFKVHSGTLPFGHGLFAKIADISSLTMVWRGTIEPLLCDATGSISPAYREAHDSFPFS